MNEEERATMTGWTPKDGFKGDPERWVEAEKWNERTDTVMPILKASNRKLETALGATQTELTALKKTMKQVVNVAETVSKREYDRALATIRKEQAAAIDDSDSAKYMELEAQKDKLEKPEKVEVPEPANDGAIMEEWKQDNPWYGKDPDLTAYARGVGDDLAKQGIHGPAQLAEVTKKVQKLFPAKFENTRRTEQTVGGDSDLPPKKAGTKKGYASLPDDAKAMCDSLCKDVPNYTKEDYLKDYYEGDE